MAWEIGVIRRIRLASGLILFTYLISHFFNHSLGLISLDVMESVLDVLYRFWASWPMTIALYGALATHFALALYALWQRQTLRLRPVEATQYALGFLLPLILVEHVMATRVSDTFFGAEFGYYRSILTAYFHGDPTKGVLQGT